jgi:hypothetical protein
MRATPSFQGVSRFGPIDRLRPIDQFWARDTDLNGCRTVVIRQTFSAPVPLRLYCILYSNPTLLTLSQRSRPSNMVASQHWGLPAGPLLKEELKQAYKAGDRLVVQRVTLKQRKVYKHPGSCSHSCAQSRIRIAVLSSL